MLPSFFALGRRLRLREKILREMAEREGEEGTGMRG
jgi:hypothetical protein